MDRLVRLPAPTLPIAPAALPDVQHDPDTPIVIDNGASTLRFQFADASTPLVAPNTVAKYKDRRTNTHLLLFGDALDAETAARSQAKSPWEGDVLLNSDALEHALDYVFIRLGVETVNRPVFLTERLCPPLHSRALTSELLFELYLAPAVAYAIDAPMAFYSNNRPPPGAPFDADGLVLSFNTFSTSVIPMLDGRGILSQAKRIPWGGSQTSDYLLKLIQLKYPSFPTRVTTTQTNWIQHNFCEFATDYPALLRHLKDPLNMRAAERIIQFPFAVPLLEEKTEEELARIADKRREQGRRLQEIAAKARVDKLLQKENDLQYLRNLRDDRGEDTKRGWMNKLQAEGFDSDATLDDTIKKLEADLKKARKKDTAEGDDIIEEPSFPLVDVPDTHLDEEGLKEKRRQKLMKAGFDARARARREKEREREDRERDKKLEEEEREADLDGWTRRLRQEQEALMSRIKSRSRRKAALTDRKSAAAQARMKSIAVLAAEERVTKKKRKGGGEDMFGADDADWAIYRKINTAVESSDEEEDFAQLQTVEQKLLTHDPSFTLQQTHASLTSQRSALISAFRPVYEEGDIEGRARIHLSTERWRVCEAYFSPGMAGVDSAGLGEVIQNVLGRFSENEKGRLVNNVFLAGAPSQFPNLVPRLHATLRPILPPEMTFNIHQAADPPLDAWKGMAHFGLTSGFPGACISRAMYEEHGAERIIRWWGGNWNASTTR